METKLLWTVAATALLLACGGGGGGGGGYSGLPISGAPPSPEPNPNSNSNPSPNPSPAPDPAPNPAPTPITANYKFLTFEQNVDIGNDPPEKRFNDYVALLNREGALGYRYIAGSPGGNNVSLQDSFMMVKDSETTYSYEYKTFELDIMRTDGLARLLQQMKEQGAQGKVLVQFLPQMTLSPPPNLNPVFGILYRKDEGSSATYDFDAFMFPNAMADLVNGANARGANGFRPWATPSMLTQGKAQFFIKDLSSSARYELKAVVSPLSLVGGETPHVKAQIREQGALGYRLVTERFMTAPDGTRPSYIFYVKDLTQSSTFEYEFLENPDPVFGLQAANAAQANGQTANGLRYLALPDAPVFFRSLNCAGPLCVSPTLLETSE